MQCKAIFYHGLKSSIRHVHTHLPTPCFNVALSMSGRRWESWTNFYFIVLNINEWKTMRELDKLLFHSIKYVNTTQIIWFSWSHYTFAFIFGFMIFFFFFKSYLKKAINICSETTIINCTHITIIIIQFKKWVKKKFVWRNIVE